MTLGCAGPEIGRVMKDFEGFDSELSGVGLF